MKLMTDERYVELFGHLPAHDTDRIREAITGLHIEAGDVGPRGAIYNWRVMDGYGKTVYASPDKRGCIGFVQGIFIYKLSNH